MSNIIALTEGFTLPAYLVQDTTDNNDLTAHASKAFPYISIKGKVFTIVKGDERMIVPNPKDKESPATSIPIVLVKVNSNKSKAYYAEAFKEGAEDVKPTCFSTDGKYPDPRVENPQCRSCAACKWNQFGTARGDNGTGKGKACSDSVHIAVVPANGPYDEAYMVRVPPASMKNLGDYGTLLNRRKLPYQAVVTKLGFDATQATPRLTFQAVGVVDEPTYKQIKTLADSDQVSSMLHGTSDISAPAETTPTPAPTEAFADTGAKETPASKANQMVHDAADEIIMQSVAPTEPKPQTINGDSLGDALAGMGFDD